MTEERIKELARINAKYVILPDRLGADATYDELEECQQSLETLSVSLIRTVAAEARNEAIDEIVGWVKGWDDAGPKHIYVGDIYKKAARLKESK